MSKNEGDQRAKFDPKFESEDFDAEACLRVPDLNSIALPYPDVEAYRHLAHALPLLPKAEQDAYSPEALKGGVRTPRSTVHSRAREKHRVEASSTDDLRLRGTPPSVRLRGGFPCSRE